jgi:integrase
MPSGACTIARKGKRGTVWYVKFRDSHGRQVKERLGKASEGWTKRKAEAELRARLVAVEKDGYSKPERETFETFALDWLTKYSDAHGLKRSTRKGYEEIIRNHLLEGFGSLQVAEVTVARIERFLAAKAKAGYSAGTRNRILNVLSLMLRAAQKQNLIRENPIPLVDRPKERRRSWRIFKPEEVAAVEQALDEMIAEAENDRDRDDVIVVRRLFLLHMATGVRRGEAAGLRWRTVFLADPDGAYFRVEETWVRHATESPKSEAGRRTIALGQRFAGELFEHRRWSEFDGDDDYVFPNPRTGRPFDASRYAKLIGKARRRAGITEYVRPSHDLRHSSITNAARAGTPPEALMTRAGHSSYATTRRYINLAGSRFSEEADRLEKRLWGTTGTNNGYQGANTSPSEATDGAADPRG